MTEAEARAYLLEEIATAQVGGRVGMETSAKAEGSATLTYQPKRSEREGWEQYAVPLRVTVTVEVLDEEIQPPAEGGAVRKG